MKVDPDEIIKEINNPEYQSSIKELLEGLESDQKMSDAIDEIFEQTTDLNEIQTKIVILITKRAEQIAPSREKGKKGVELDAKKLAKDISKLAREFVDERIKQEADIEHDVILDKRDKHHHITGKAKSDFKRIVKNMAIYEAYKVMNPKRIAGETKKDNYRHNMVIGGKKLAAKHEGGKAHEVSSYNAKFIKNVNKTVRAFRKKGGGGIGR